MDNAWVVVLAALALLVRVGQLVGAMGIARAKNVASAGARNLADLCVATLCCWAIGAAVFFADQSVFGLDLGQIIGWSVIEPEWLGILPLVLIATGIVTPVLAERSRLAVPLVLGGLLAGLLVPIVAHWTWRGWLGRMGFFDVAGAGAVHVAPALCVMIAAGFVGARDAKYNRDGSSNMIPGHSVLMLVLSAMLTVVGWVPYMVLADTFGRLDDGYRRLGYNDTGMAANALIAAAAAGLVSMLVTHVRYGKVDILQLCSGVLGGLVSITAAGGMVGTPAAFVIGAVAGILVPWMTVIIDMRWKIDDPAGMIAIHGVGGIWALLAAALFRPVDLWSRLTGLPVQLLGIVVIAATTVVLTAIVMLVLKGFTSLRCSDADEFDGLDLAEHDINAHPDFQQTMIKSYHLREA